MPEDVFLCVSYLILLVLDLLQTHGLAEYIAQVPWHFHLQSLLCLLLFMSSGHVECC